MNSRTRTGVLALLVAIAIPSTAVASPNSTRLDEKTKKRVQRVAEAIASSFGVPIRPEHREKFRTLAIERFDKNCDGQLEKKEISRLLRQASIGSAFTRGSWSGGLLDLFDVDSNDRLGCDELESAFSRLCLVMGTARCVEPTQPSRIETGGTADSENKLTSARAIESASSSRTLEELRIASSSASPGARCELQEPDGIAIIREWILHCIRSNEGGRASVLRQIRLAISRSILSPSTQIVSRTTTTVPERSQ